MGAIIEVENLGKKYLISHQRRGRQGNLRDAMTHTARGVWQRLRHPLSPNKESLDLEEMWALKDVSFEVQQGERLGIIGRNGAGKSTLLKILSRITQPTTGSVHLRGRVSSLLEVGTGFHPELTGRENIFLNGAILGMTRREVKAKFDEIVAFAEVERFLDTPVRHYSSGMYVRLAFAVAAHLEPEILIVDEVLSVGDAQFQKKCLGRMEDVTNEGRTVLFVSHNMPAIRRLCSQAVVLVRGRVALSGEVGAAIDAYLNQSGVDETLTRHDFGLSGNRLQPYFLSAEIRNSTGEPAVFIKTGEPFNVSLTVRNPQETNCQVVLGVEVLDSEGHSLFTSHSDDATSHFFNLAPGTFRTSCQFCPNPLMPGKYTLQLGMVDRQWSVLDLARPDLVVRIEDTPYASSCLSVRRPGRLLLKFPWEQE